MLDGFIEVTLLSLRHLDPKVQWWHGLLAFCVLPSQCLQAVPWASVYLSVPHAWICTRSRALGCPGRPKAVLGWLVVTPPSILPLGNDLDGAHILCCGIKIHVNLFMSSYIVQIGL